MSSPRLTLRLCDATFRVVPFMVILVVLAPYLWPLDAGPTSGLNDIRTFQAPNVQFLSAEIRANGELPRWNPQDFAGIPLVGDPQAGVYNPVNWLLALRPTLNSCGWLIVVSAGCGAWGLLRLASAFGYSDAAAAVGAVVFAVGGKLLLHLVDLGHVVMAAFFLVPWLMLMIDRCVRCPSGLRVVVAAMLLALIVVWMHSQLLVYTVIFLVAWSFLMLWQSPRAWRGLGVLTLVVVWAAALAAVHVLPVLSFVGEFARAVPELASPARTSAPLVWSDLVMGAARSPESRFAFGGVTLLLIVLGLVTSRIQKPSRSLVPFCGSVVLVVLLYAHDAFLDVPLAPEIFRHPSRALIVMSVPIALLAASGLDGVAQAPVLGRRLAIGVSTAFAVSCLVIAGGAPQDFLLVAVAAVAVVLWAEGGSPAGLSRQALHGVAGLVVIGAVGFDAGSRVAASVRTAPEAEIAERAWGGGLLPGVGLPTGRGAYFRFAEPDRERLMRGMPELEKRRLGVESLTGYNSLVPWRFLVYVAYASGMDPNEVSSRYVTTVPVRRERPALFDRLSASHFLYPPRRAGEPWAWEAAESPLPRAHLVSRWGLQLDGAEEEPVASALRALERLEEFDARERVLLHGEAARAALVGAGIEPGELLEPFRPVAIEERRPHSMTFALETTRPAILVINDPFFPGWVASDQGEPVTVLRANVLSRAIVLEPGVHRIEMSFRPLSWRVGWWISLIAVGASLCVLLWSLLCSTAPGARTARMVSP